MNKTKTITQYYFKVDDIFTVNISLVIRADGSLRKRTDTHITNNVIRGAYKNKWRKNNPELNSKQRARHRSKRKGWKSPIVLNNHFIDAHLHHMHIDGDHRIAIYIPAILHQSVSHRWHDTESMLAINQTAMIWYYIQWSRLSIISESA